MKIVLAAVTFSPNLGDGLIAECLSAELRRQRAAVAVQWLDLAGRSAFIPPSRGLRTRALDLLARLPEPLSQAISARLVARQVATRLAPRVPEAMADADLVVIGGGQLLGDANLNFPLKIGHVAAAAEARDLPIALHGVGVSARWSRRGRALFARLLLSPNLRFVSVRDATSAENLARHYADLGTVPSCPIRVFPDPGLLAADLKTSGFAIVAGAGRPVGLGVAHPAAIITHSDKAQHLTVEHACAQYRSLAEALVRRGARVHLFTNGSGEDEEMLDALMASWPEHADKVVRLPRFATPIALVEFIGRMEAIASYRLHACIAAHAQGIPAAGFRWDAKVDAYFELLEQGALLFADPGAPEEIAERLLAAPRAPIAQRVAALRPVIAEGVAELFAAFPDL